MKDSQLYKNYAKNIEELKTWLISITRHGEHDKFVVLTTIHMPVTATEEARLKVEFWTEQHKYVISARLPNKQDTGWLGCMASARKPRTGEDWTRGNDLPDGIYCEETWRRIVNGILAYELCQLEVSEQQASVEEVPTP